MEELFLPALNVRGVNDIKHTDIHKAESLVPKPSDFDFEFSIGKLKSHKSPGIDQITA